MMLHSGVRLVLSSGVRLVLYNGWYFVDRVSCGIVTCTRNKYA